MSKKIVAELLIGEDTKVFKKRKRSIYEEIFGAKKNTKFFDYGRVEVKTPKKATKPDRWWGDTTNDNN